VMKDESLLLVATSSSILGESQSLSQPANIFVTPKSQEGIVAWCGT
jgi:hypothetical protein